MSEFFNGISQFFTNAGTAVAKTVDGVVQYIFGNSTAKCTQLGNTFNSNNRCDPSTHIVLSICTDITDKAKLNKICSSLSDEWTAYGLQSDKDRCPCRGKRLVCQRQRFDGDPRRCCINDMKSTGATSACFSDLEQKKTCDPEYRSSISEGCRNVFTSTCVNGLHSDTDFANAWEDGFCDTMVNKNSIPGHDEWMSEQMNTIFSQYFDGISGVGSSNLFQQKIYRICMNHPNICQQSLNDLCARYDRDDAVGNNNILNLCGCHMNDTVYAKYENMFGLNRNCDPICARPSVVPLTDIDGQASLCTSDVCIIDDVTIDLANSTGGNIDIQQACGGCQGSCKCYVTNVDLNAIDSTFGNLAIQQTCGVPQCYTQASDGSRVLVDCTNQEKQLQEQESAREAALIRQRNITSRNRIILISVIVIIAIAIIFAILMWFVLKRSEKRKEEYIKQRYQAILQQSLSKSSLSP